MWSRALARPPAEHQVPTPFDLGIVPLRGQLVTVLGSPGVGKSYFALKWALMAQPSCVVSLDTDMTTQAVRAAGLSFGATPQDVASNPDFWSTMLEQKDGGLRMYDLSLGPKDLLDLVMAETQFWGRPPHLLVVDNLSNLLSEMSYEKIRETVIGLHKVARMADTCVVALHHAKRDVGSGPLTIQSGQYAGEHESEIVLGLHAGGRGTGPTSLLNVQVLKNRTGPSGQTKALRFEPAQNKLEEW